MAEAERKAGLDQKTFKTYVESLPHIDKRVEYVEKETLSNAPEGQIVYQVSITFPSPFNFNIAYIPSEKGDRIGIYKPLRKLDQANLPLDLVNKLADWWEQESPDSFFKIGLTEDGVLFIGGEGAAPAFATSSTRKLINGMIGSTHKVLPELQKHFPI